MERYKDIKMNNKKFVTIECPKCGHSYLPAEIYMPDSFLGKPYDIEKTPAGKIDAFYGSTMNTAEEYTCDCCGTHFKVVANVNFKTYEIEDKKKFSDTYVSSLRTKKISLFEG